MRHFLLLALLLPMAVAAATLQTAYVPPAGGTIRDARLDTHRPKPAPMPAPAPTNHYASPPTSPPAWKI